MSDTPTPISCQWRKDCPKLKTCKRDMSVNGIRETTQERAAEAAIRLARRSYGKAIRNAERPLRIEDLRAGRQTEDPEIPF